MEATLEQVLAVLGEEVVKVRLLEQDIVIGAEQLKGLEAEIQELRGKLTSYENEMKKYQDQGAD